jgi:hypothetical protein
MGAIQAKIANPESMILCAINVLGLVFIKVLLKTCCSWYLSAPRWTDRGLGELPNGVSYWEAPVGVHYFTRWSRIENGYSLVETWDFMT